MEEGRIMCTKNPTGHAVLVDCRFEYPYGKCQVFFPTAIYVVRSLFFSFVFSQYIFVVLISYYIHLFLDLDEINSLKLIP